MTDDASNQKLSALRPAELPSPPASTWSIVGPGVVAAGVGMASGEFILYPFIASQVGLSFLWAAAVGLLTQFFINMEIERYTLATGETALTGFSRLGRHWGLFFVVMTAVANLWPGWVTGAATLLTYLIGGSVPWIAAAMLLAIGLILTLSPVVYRSLEGTQMLKVALVGLFVLVSILVAIPGDLWLSAPALAADVRLPYATLGWPLLLGALAYAGAGGGQNLCQSNWIRDKGFGMGAHAPRIVSPLTGEPVAASGTGWCFEPDEASLKRWRRWWQVANAEQLLTFVAISMVTIIFTSILAVATLQGRSDLPSGLGFLAIEATALAQAAGSWFGSFFFVVGAFSLFAAALGIVDYTSRLGADVIRTVYWRGGRESLVYATLVWTMVILGIVILMSGMDQPLVLLVIAGCVSGIMMFFYSGLLIRLNLKLLPQPLRPAPHRILALVWAVLLFGLVSALTLSEQVMKVFA